MQELLVPMTKSFPVALETWRRHHWRIAVTRITIERRWTPSVHVVACGIKAIVRTLLLDRLVVECWRWWRGKNWLLV
jgi:hypothetical protein